MGILPSTGWVKYFVDEDFVIYELGGVVDLNFAIYGVGEAFRKRGFHHYQHAVKHVLYRICTRHPLGFYVFYRIGTRQPVGSYVFYRIGTR